MIKLAEIDKCTACGACEQVCAQHNILLVNDMLGNLYPQLINKECVDCRQCLDVCHAIHKQEYRFPMHAFAAWSKSKKIQEKSASGGVAAEIYKYCINNKIFCMGTIFLRKEGVLYKEVRDYSDIEWARNSKYVYSDMRMTFQSYEKRLKEGQKCIFIGLPCQVAALKQYLSTKCDDITKLVTVDLICHGAPPWEYLNDHLTFLETKYGIIENISFRGPNSDYNLVCMGKDDKQILKKNMHSDDTYYRAFCECINFRKNCYYCKYARYERISDITIGDYSGLGDLWDYNGKKEMVSLVLVNTVIGNELVFDLTDELEFVERHICEPPSAKGNEALRNPAFSRNRERFEDVYKRITDNSNKYELAAKAALRQELFRWKLQLPYIFMKMIILNY